VIRRLLLIAAIAGGLMAAVARTPERINVAHLASMVEREEDHVTAMELAAWIRDRKPGLRIIDLRSADEFEEYHLPRAEPMSMEKLLATTFTNRETVVLLSGGGAHAAQAWVLLQARGHRQTFFLSGGVQEWLDDVMNPVPGKGTDMELSRYFGGTPRAGDAPAADKVKEMRRRGC
jgi:rhodanese-related sulfurtransferase